MTATTHKLQRRWEMVPKPLASDGGYFQQRPEDRSGGESQRWVGIGQRGPS